MSGPSLARHAAAVAVGGLPPYVSVYDLDALEDRAAYARLVLDRAVYNPAYRRADLEPGPGREPPGASTEGGAS